MEDANFFCGGKLDRLAEKRNDLEFMLQALENKGSKVLIFVDLSPIGFESSNAKGESKFELFGLNFSELAQCMKTYEESEKSLQFVPKQLLENGRIVFLGGEKVHRILDTERSRISKETEAEEATLVSTFYFAMDVGDTFKLENDGLLGLFSSHSNTLKVLKSRMDILKLGKVDAAYVSQSRSMLDWNKRYQFCPTCGSHTKVTEAGYKRACINKECSSNRGIHNTSYPRTDPVVISVVISEDKNRILLGRKKVFPPNMYSCLAGFMEPGESIEEAVRREVQEESGIIVGQVKYVSSQPWPYPSVLMIGCISWAQSEEITVCQEELEDAKWFHVKDIESALKDNTNNPSVPPSQTIAHQLIKTWYHTYTCPKL